MNSKHILTIYNTLLSSHKALPKDAEERLAAGEHITIYNGTEEQWTSKLVLTQKRGALIADMVVAENVPERMRAHLLEKQTRFRAQVQL